MTLPDHELDLAQIVFHKSPPRNSLIYPFPMLKGMLVHGSGGCPYHGKLFKAFSSW